MPTEPIEQENEVIVTSTPNDAARKMVKAMDEEGFNYQQKVETVKSLTTLIDNEMAGEIDAYSAEIQRLKTLRESL